MADVKKAEKLAAARKKLKEFQQKSKDTPPAVSEAKRSSQNGSKLNDNESQSYFESLKPLLLKAENLNTDNNVTSNNALLVAEEKSPNRFHTSANYFDNQANLLNYEEALITHSVKSNISIDSNIPLLNLSSASNFFDNLAGQKSNWYSQENKADADLVSHAPQVQIEYLPDEPSIIPFHSPTHAAESFMQQPIDLNSNIPISMPETTESLETARIESQYIKNIELSMPEIATTKHQDEKLGSRSTSENIRQLSMQVNGLISESMQTNSLDETSELERRNQELASLLEIEQQKNDQMHQQMQEYQIRLSQLSSQNDNALLEADAQTKSELALAQEQLQLHAQTLGILVAEKTELQSALSQCHIAAKVKASESEELQSRLKASRHRVSDLDKELTSLKAAAMLGETSKQSASMELEKLQIEHRLITSRLQEMEEEKDEISHSLLSKTSECSQLTQELYEAGTQLALAQLRVQQLSSTDGEDTTEKMEAMYQSNVQLEQQVTELKNSLQALSVDQEDSSRHYQQYVTTLDTQLRNLTEKVDSYSTENQQLKQREESLVKLVAQLEKGLQDQMQNKVEPVNNQTELLNELQARVDVIEAEKQALNEQLAQKLQVTTGIVATLNDRESRIEELEALIHSMQKDQPDQARLLAAMESDKVAAARAVSQNQILKQEWQELQDMFVNLSNDKLDLTDKLEHQRYVNRELTLQAEQKDNQISELRLQVSQEHNHDHDSHSHIADILHRELAQSKERIEALSQQNLELRTIVSQQGNAQNIEKSQLVSTVQQLELEKVQLMERLNESSDITEGNNVITKQAMDQLQERFTKTMAEVAELSDEKQRLEHLVLQLQGETETIGEYITLYQKQRSLLRERAEEKDIQLKCLAQDREEMRSKLSQLNKLIQRLVTEKGSEATEQVLGQITNGELLEMSASMANNDQVKESSAENVDTADKIMALLTEIGSSNLVDPQQLVEHFHPCPWCSGRLITV